MSEGSAVKAKTKDWHSSKDMRKRARYLLDHPDEQIPSDVTFLVGDGSSEPQKIFKCHKFILAMVSSMFQAMFYGSLPETEDVVRISDVTPAAFQNMLCYAYGENIQFDCEELEEALDTLYCSKKYLIDKLARICRDHLQFCMDEEPCVVLQRAPQIGEDDLATLALSEIALRTTQAMREDGLPRLSFDCLKRIVDYPYLNATEAIIYEGVRRWVAHNVGVVTGSALRDALGSLLHSIRFPLFSAVELATGPVKDDVLTPDELRSLFQYHFADVKPAVSFLTTPRIPLAAPLNFIFQMLSGRVGGSAIRVKLYAYPNLAPETCAFLRQLVDGNCRIRIASFDNEHAGQSVPLTAAVQEECNVLSHSIEGACWFEWDLKNGTPSDVRIAVGKKPHRYHSAVFGFVLGIGGRRSLLPFERWNDFHIQGIANFAVIM